MKLTVVGCAGSYPNAESPSSCYLVEHEGFRVVLDMGNGSMGALQRYVDLADPESIDAIILSHCHVDHCADVSPYYVLRKWGPAKAAARLPLIGPRSMVQRLVDIDGMSDAAPLLEQFDIDSLGGASFSLGPFTVESAVAAHPVEAFSVRLTAGGRSITYSGDTGPTDVLGEFARGTDIALFEASCVGTDNPPDLHMTGAEAARIASTADAGMLVLTHLVAWNDDAVVMAEAAPEFSGPLEQARPGMTITL